MSTTEKIDFMSPDYAMIGEPLNLLEDGQRWFRRMYYAFNGKTKAVALILGATPWLGLLCKENHRTVIFSDMSSAMLNKASEAFERAGFSKNSNEVHCIQSDWLRLPHLAQRLDTVCADNSFAFLIFPTDWERLLSYVADSMPSGGIFLARFFEHPTSHRSETVPEIIEFYLHRNKVNFTEVRARLMFSILDQESSRIDTEAAVAAFEANGEAFSCLINRFSENQPNDLVTIRKYKDSGISLYAPPVNNILDLLRKDFDVERVGYGPYALASYFPLIIARRK